MVGLSPTWSANLYIELEDLPTFRKVIAEVAASYPVKHYDVGDKFMDIRPIDIQICSEDGLYVSATKLGGSTKVEVVMIDVFVYESNYDWEPIAAAMESAIIARWPEDFDNRPSRTTDLRNSLL